MRGGGKSCVETGGARIGETWVSNKRKREKLYPTDGKSENERKRKVGDN